MASIMDPASLNSISQVVNNLENWVTDSFPIDLVVYAEVGNDDESTVPFDATKSIGKSFFRGVDPAHSRMYFPSTIIGNTKESRVALSSYLNNAAKKVGFQLVSRGAEKNKAGCIQIRFRCTRGIRHHEEKREKKKAQNEASKRQRKHSRPEGDQPSCPFFLRVILDGNNNRWYIRGFDNTGCTRHLGHVMLSEDEVNTGQPAKKKSKPAAAAAKEKRRIEGKTIEQHRSALGNEVKKNIQVEKWAVKARTFMETTTPLEVFETLVVPYCDCVTPADFGKTTPVVVATATTNLGEIFGHSKIKGGTRLGSWTADKGDLIYYPSTGKMRVWWTMK